MGDDDDKISEEEETALHALVDDPELTMLLKDMGLDARDEVGRARRRRLLDARRRRPRLPTHIATMGCGRCKHIMKTVHFSLAADGSFEIGGFPNSCDAPTCQVAFGMKSEYSIVVTLYRKMSGPNSDW